MLKIQWYPGHMNKAKKILEKQLKNIDLVIEVLDARIPNSSRNPIIKNLIKSKKHIIILNKADLSTKIGNNKWTYYFKKLNILTITLKGTEGKSKNKIISCINKIKKDFFDKRKKSGLLERNIRCIVLGISNVGKSSLINTLKEKKIAKTENKPGITRGIQWVSIGNKIDILDTPGLLWPKFEDQLTGFNLAITGAIADSSFNSVDVVLKLIELYIPKENLKKFNNNAHSYLKNYSRKLGFLDKKNIENIEKGSLAFLKNFKNGKLGKITLEVPKEII